MSNANRTGRAMTSQKESIQTLLQNFHHTVLSENSDLIELLGIAKQLKSTSPPNAPFTLSSIVRGLYTKNNRLISLVAKTMHEFDQYGTERFKNFINDFILWIQDDSIVLFEKYIAQLSTVLADDAATLKRLVGPINSLRDYANFIGDCIHYLRNPFILEKLSTISKQLRAIHDNYEYVSHSREVNNIQFSNIRSFRSTVLKQKELVSSYFKTDQIIRRTAHANISLCGDQIELLLLDLIGTGDYNALAVLEITRNSQHEICRSLRYPPFRVNELSMSHSGQTIELKAINFSSTENPGSSMQIHFEDELLCDKWIRHLSKLCPLERDNSPVSEKFLINSDSSSYNMSGLGINIVSDADRREAVSNKVQAQPTNSANSFKEPFESPASSPTKSRASSESIRSQYEKSLPIMKKVITEQRNCDHDDDDNDDDEKLFQIINRRKYSDDCSNDEERPKSYQAEYCSPESVQSMDNDDIEGKPIAPPQIYQNTFATSAPDLGIKPKMYQLSTGSAVDITNFGQSHQPSFKGYPEKRPRRKSILTFFKKSSKVDLNESQESLTTIAPRKAESQPPQVPPSATQATASEIDSNPEKTMPRSVSNIPAPFALPSSTSTYFFKPHVNASVTSIAKQHNNLEIPTDLKDVINSELTSDVYVSESSPKAIKISKWKHQYGKWEMITASENVFVKIAVNQEAQKSWFLVFKEEYDEDIEEIMDKPVLLLDINSSTEVRSSSGSDLQIQSKNAINKEAMQIMIRCSKGALISEIRSNLQNCIGMATNSTRHHSLSASKLQTSDNTLSSSLMDNPSKSSTFTSLSSLSNSMNGDDLSNACIINNPNAIHTREIEMTIRLQKQLQSYSQRNSPSSWKIMSMMNLCVEKIVDHHQVVYHLRLNSGSDVISWVITDDRKSETIEKIGKAGLLIKISESELYMLECRGRKEFKQLYEIF
ncbi:hypothetical protein CANMA_005495 [Candida margitis]|uniref:uncharacterized protein n=1 Tax=Candida margitis TaxID=1775924 RepID=UPI002227E17A|nr:uncharacterized protein CANMA_005495 [Candida margitis]KAI5949688.1 hypothetical protein CANMA_005495 [Candida margitis]